jgi:hypothetical protein
MRQDPQVRNADLSQIEARTVVGTTPADAVGLYKFLLVPVLGSLALGCAGGPASSSSSGPGGAGGKADEFGAEAPNLHGTYVNDVGTQRIDFLGGGLASLTNLDSEGHILGAHPSNFEVRWSSELEATLYSVRYVDGGNPELCGSLVLDPGRRFVDVADCVDFESSTYTRLGIAAGTYTNGRQSQRIDFSEEGFTLTNLDEEGHIVGAHPSRFTVTWTSALEGAMFSVRYVDGGEPEACGRIAIAEDFSALQVDDCEAFDGRFYDRTGFFGGAYESDAGGKLDIDTMTGQATVTLPDGETTVSGSLARDGSLGGMYTLQMEEGWVCGTYRISLFESEGVVGDGSTVTVTWDRPDGSVVRDCGFMLEGEGTYSR